jgi:hypothetical protein
MIKTLFDITLMNLVFSKRQGKLCKIFVREITPIPLKHVSEVLKAYNIVTRQRVSKLFLI